MSAIHNSQASGGIDLAQLQAALAGIGAVQGELKAFYSSQVPAGFTPRASSIPLLPSFVPGQTVIAGRRKNTAYESNAAGPSRLAHYNGKVYILQAFATGISGSLFEVYDPITGQTRSLPSYPASLAPDDNSVPATAVVGNYLYAFGGKSGTTFYSMPQSYRFNLVLEAWEAIANSPDQLHAYGIAAYGTNIYLFGGLTAGANGYRARTAAVTRYNTLTNAFTKLAVAVPQGVGEAYQAALTGSGKILVAGGWNGYSMMQFSVFNPATETFGAAYNLPATLGPLGQLSPSAVGCTGLSQLAGNAFHTFVSFNESTNSWSVSPVAMPMLSAWAYGPSILADGSHFSPGRLVAGNWFHTRTYINAPIDGIVIASKD